MGDAHAREEFLETFGILGNVKMKAAEYRLLVEDYGQQAANDAIDDLSCKLADGNVDSSNHYATLLSWLRYQRRMDAGRVPMSSAQAAKAPIADRIADLKKLFFAMSEADQKIHLDTHGGKYPWDDDQYMNQ